MPNDQDQPVEKTTTKATPEMDAKAEAPTEYPPFVDPEGRRVLPIHRRKAIRRARRLGLEPVDGNHALLMLAEKGYDPFAEQDNLLDVAKAQQREKAQSEEATGADSGPGRTAAETPGGPSGAEDATAVAGAAHQLAKVSSPKSLAKNPPKDLTEVPKDITPAAKPSQKTPAKAAAKPAPEADRSLEILKIQRGLIRRRRMRLFGLVFRLLVFVAAPTAAVTYYFYAIATNMYATESSFVIQTADSSMAMPGIGSIFGTTALATSQDSVVVQEYLKSREAFVLLDDELSYASHFKDPDIDPVQRLHKDASLDEAYELFKKNVTIGFDPSEGLVRMSVVGTTPQASQAFSEALVRYAELRVDGLTQAARGDQMDAAQQTYEDAERKMDEALQRVLNLQQRFTTLNPEAEITLQMEIIASLEREAENQRLELAEILDNPGPNQTRAELLQKELDRRYARISELRENLIETGDETASLARISAELRTGEAELETRQVLLQQALQQMETARIEANRQVRYLSLAVAPVAPLEPSHPRKFENSVLALLLFLAIYVMVSLTVSILREQISV